MSKFKTVQVMGTMWVCWFLPFSIAVLVSADSALYKDPNQPVSVRVKDLLSRMTLEEKIGQMTQIDRMVATPDILRTHFIGTTASTYYYHVSSCTVIL